MTDRQLRKAAPGTVVTVQVDFKHNTIRNSADKEIARFTAAGWELVNQAVLGTARTFTHRLLTGPGPTQAGLTFRKTAPVVAEVPAAEPAPAPPTPVTAPAPPAAVPGPEAAPWWPSGSAVGR